MTQATSSASSSSASKKMITDVFVEGARKGWNIGAMSTIPNVMMAFIIIKALNVTGAHTEPRYIKQYFALSYKALTRFDSLQR